LGEKSLGTANETASLLSELLMKRYFMGRLFAWVVSAFVSWVMAFVVALGILAVAFLTRDRHQEFIGVGVGMFTMAFIWPGLLTLCLILGDGFVLEGFSKKLWTRSILWGLIPSALIFILYRFGISWMALADAVVGTRPWTLVSLLFFVSPSLITAFFGILLRPAGRGGP